MQNLYDYIKIPQFLSVDPCMSKECGSSRKCSVTADKEAVCGKVYCNVFVMLPIFVQDKFKTECFRQQTVI